MIEEISRVCANMGVILSVNNSLVCDPIEKFGNDDAEEAIPRAARAGREARLLRADRARRGLRRRQPEDAGGPGRRGLPDLGPEGLHHVRPGRRRLPALRDDEPGEEGHGDLRVSGRCRHAGLRRSRHQVKLGVNASGTVEIFLTDVRRRRRRTARRGGRRLQDRDVDARRRPDRHRRAGGRDRAARPSRPRSRYAKARHASASRSRDFQVIRFYLADMATEIDAARLLTRRAAAAKDTAKKHGGRYGLEAAMAKLFAAEMAQRVTTKALQIHGGYGYTKEYPVERNFRDARITEIYEGTSEIHRLIIAREDLRRTRAGDRIDEGSTTWARTRDVPGPRGLDGADARGRREASRFPEGLCARGLSGVRIPGALARPRTRPLRHEPRGARRPAQDRRLDPHGALRRRAAAGARWRTRSRAAAEIVAFLRARAARPGDRRDVPSPRGRLGGHSGAAPREGAEATRRAAEARGGEREAPGRRGPPARAASGRPARRARRPPSPRAASPASTRAAEGRRAGAVGPDRRRRLPRRGRAGPGAAAPPPPPPARARSGRTGPGPGAPGPPGTAP